MENINYGIYIRKSSEEEERQVLSLSSQKDKITERFPDLMIKNEFTESKSAFEPNKRPDFKKLLDLLDKGILEGIIAWHPDRLCRNEVDAAEISWRIRKGIIKDLKFASGFTFENTPEGIMMLQLTMSQSQYFSAKLSKDVRRGNEKKRQMGGITGRAHEGYMNQDRQAIIDPDRYPVIRKAFDLFLTGEYSVQSIYEIMKNEWGYKTIQRRKIGGKELSRSSLYYIFRNVRYAGLIPDPYKPGEFYKANFRAMITIEEYDRVQSLLGRHGSPRLTARKEFSLRGFIHCGECGCSITAQSKQKRLKNGQVNVHTYYHCTGKRKGCQQNKHYIKESDLFDQLQILLGEYELDSKLQDWALEALHEFSNEEIKSRDKIQNMQNQSIKKTQDQLDKLLDLATKGLIGDSEFSNKSESLKESLKKIQDEQSDTNYRVKNWYEVMESTINTLTNVTEKFVNGAISDKREILLAIGQNPILKDNKLSITPNKWLKPVSRELKDIKCELQKVRTGPLQIQKTSEEAIMSKWCTRQDSNL